MNGFSNSGAGTPPPRSPRTPSVDEVVGRPYAGVDSVSRLAVQKAIQNAHDGVFIAVNALAAGGRQQDGYRAAAHAFQQAADTLRVLAGPSEEYPVPQRTATPMDTSKPRPGAEGTR